MKAEYDFSKGERGKFFRPDAELRLPIYLSADVQAFLAERAASKGVPLSEMVKALLKQEIQIIESVKWTARTRCALQFAVSGVGPDNQISAWRVMQTFACHIPLPSGGKTLRRSIRPTDLPPSDNRKAIVGSKVVRQLADMKTWTRAISN